MNRHPLAACVVICLFPSFVVGGGPEPDKQPIKTLKVGEVGRAGGYAVVCGGWQETPDMGRQLPFNMPAGLLPNLDAGPPKRRLLVDVSVVNVSKDPLGVFPGQLVLVDDAGQVYQPELEALNFADPSLFPGERLRHILAFRIPKTAAKLRLLFSTVPLRPTGEAEFIPFVKLIDPNKSGPFAPAAAVADIGVVIVDGGIVLLNAAIALDKVLNKNRAVEAVAFDLSERASRQPGSRAKTARPSSAVYIDGEQRPLVAKPAQGAKSGGLTIKAQNISLVQVQNPLFKARPESVVIQVDFQISNAGKAAYDMSPWDISLVTPEGQRFGRAWHVEVLNHKLPALSLPKPGQPLPPLDLAFDDLSSFLVFKSIAPGGNAMMTLTFEVPQGAPSLRIRFVPFRSADTSPQLVELTVPRPPKETLPRKRRTSR